ncbi:IS630 family transposase [Nostoc flagelliforme]|uniref:IS630 family transposase n=1 Tax=Nostoc flagelliforme TaxID=1306274 RepID=UPI0021F0DD41|nr:IS630 family transposase [Nostoc flagelliforme]
MRYLCQDETRLGLKTMAGRLITAAGVKPLGLSQWQRENFYLYGVVELLSGYSFFYEFSHLDGDCFQRFLELLSAQLGDDVAVIQFDQGSFHRVKALDCPENIIPIFQPPHSPELNPIERFWEFLKSKLEWENCKTLNQLRQKLAQVLDTITPEVIASLTSYDFILEALFSAAS